MNLNIKDFIYFKQRKCEIKLETPTSQTLLILKSPSYSASSVTHFLSNRGWTIHQADTLKECLQLLIAHKPQFLLISINHQDPAALRLGRVLGRTLPICVINFAEQDNAITKKNLDKAETPYKLHFPITGPAVERIVHKYQKDLSHSKIVEYKTRENGEAPVADTVIAIKGQKFKVDATSNFLKGYDSLDTQSILNALSSGEEDIKMLSDSTQKALDECVVKLDTPDVTNIQNTSNIACIVVESDKFSGYLIAAMGKNSKIDSDFIDKIQDRLYKFLRQQGEKIDESERSLQLKIKEVDFEGWALDYAEFLRKSVHKGDEVAMAFFPYADARTRTGRSSKDEMVSVSLREITSDVFLDFNVYLYLMKNDRYVLYTPKGGILYHHQKDKLLLQNIESLHVLKADLQAVTALKAQSFLNEKVDQFETRKTGS